MTCAIRNKTAPGGWGTSVPHKPIAKGGFAVPVIREKTFKGIKFAVVKNPEGVLALIDSGASPVVVSHPDGSLFNHTQSAISTAKTVIRWYLTFGEWRLPK